MTIATSQPTREYSSCCESGVGFNLSLDVKTSLCESEMADSKKADNIVISLRLNPEVATAFRTEAARRNTRLVRLFEEMWELYRSKVDRENQTPGKRR